MAVVPIAALLLTFALMAVLAAALCLAVMAIAEIPLRQGREGSEDAMGGDAAREPEDILPVPAERVAAR